jgi:hypothetical protein
MRRYIVCQTEFDRRQEQAAIIIQVKAYKFI